MKKIFKLLFSRLSLVCVAIFIQLCLYIFIPVFIGERFPAVPINLILSILSFLIIILIINSDMKIEGQLPIIIICILAPIIGIIVCVLFITPTIPKKIKKYHSASKNQLEKYMEIPEKELIKLKDSLKDDFGQFNYIINSTGLRPFLNSKVEFYNTGESFFEELKKELKKAQKYIFMEYFIIEKGKMWGDIYGILKEKASNGVEVRVMYDDLGTITKLPSNFAKLLIKNNIKCVKYNEYSSKTSAIYNNRDHRKITVIDGKVGFMGGVNLADEYINEKQPYGYFKDTAIKIRGQAVKSLICMFLQLYNIQSKITEDFSKYIVSYKYQNDSDEKLEISIKNEDNNNLCEENNNKININYETKNVNNSLDNEEELNIMTSVVCPFGDGPKYFYGEQIGENVFINLISQAKKYVYITTPYLIIDSKLKTALINASKRGVQVKIVTPHIPDKKLVFSITRSNYKALIEGGVEIFEYKEGFIHAKQILIDDKFAVVGTINFDYRSLIHHYECGTLMYKCDCLADIKADFENIFLTAINMKDFKQNYFAKMFCALVKLFTPLL